MKKNNKIVVEVLVISLIFIVSSVAVIPRAQALEGKQAWGQVDVEQSFWPYWWWSLLNIYNLKIWYFTGSHYGMEYIHYYYYDDWWWPFSGWLFQTENLDIDEFFVGASLIGLTFTATVKIYNTLDTNQWGRFVFTISILAGEDLSEDSYSFELIEDHIPGKARYKYYGIYMDYTDPYIIGTIYG